MAGNCSYKSEYIFLKHLIKPSINKEFNFIIEEDGLYITLQQFVVIILFTGASLIAHLVKNPPAMQETLIQFLGQEDLLQKGEATHSSILGLPWWLNW